MELKISMCKHGFFPDFFSVLNSNTGICVSKLEVLFGLQVPRAQTHTL